jgi:hypothetical protein
MNDKYYRFTFWTGQVYYGYGKTPRDALERLGLGAYNPVAYEWEEVVQDGSTNSAQ